MELNIPNLENVEVELGDKRKLVARLTNYSRQLRVDLRYWNMYDKVNQFIPLKNQGIFMKLEDLRKILPQLVDMVNRNSIDK
jgi:hypothetical protein